MEAGAERKKKPSPVADLFASGPPGLHGAKIKTPVSIEEAFFARCLGAASRSFKQTPLDRCQEQRDASKRTTARRYISGRFIDDNVETLACLFNGTRLECRRSDVGNVTVAPILFFFLLMG